jgi:hypothetical protein
MSLGVMGWRGEMGANVFDPDIGGKMVTVTMTIRSDAGRTHLSRAQRHAFSDCGEPSTATHKVRSSLCAMLQYAFVRVVVVVVPDICVCAMYVCACAFNPSGRTSDG